MFRQLFARIPSQCLVCRRWPAQSLCLPCRSRFGQPVARCTRCALPVAPGVVQCGVCLRQPPAFDACFAAVDYAYPWSMLLARYKFASEPGLAGVLAGLLCAAPGVSHALANATLVLPMPLADERLRERGFNQSLELARRLGAAHLHSTLLLRPLHRPPQSALARAERLRNVAGVFAVDPLQAGRLRGATVVLVDDVMTSGASLSAAASVLREAGARHISALVVARTPTPRQ
ncbi:MAG: ComF family protein [Pseudomonadota bacterium]